MVDLSCKNLIVSAEGRFAYLLVCRLVGDLNVNPSLLCVAFLFKKDFDKNIVKLRMLGVDCLYYEDSDKERIVRARTIGALSLSSRSSPIILNLLNISKFNYDKFYIVITDDEVDRWRRSKERYGRLDVDKSLHISKHDLEVLSKIDNFSAPKHPFKEDIKSLLGRDINISNAFDLFPVLCTEEDLLKGNILKNRTPSLMLYGREIRTISLIYTLLNLFFYTLKKNKKNISDLNVGFFIKSNSVSSVLLPVLFYPLIKIFAFKGLRLNISNHLRMEARAYFTLLNSYTAMIVPGRGGVSSFLQFIKLGGTVLCKEGTKNSDMLDHEGVEYIKYNRVSDAIDVLFNSVVHKGSADLLISSQKNKETFDKVKKYNSFFFNRLYGDKDISFSECIKDAQINSKQ